MEQLELDVDVFDNLCLQMSFAISDDVVCCLWQICELLICFCFFRNLECKLNLRRVRIELFIICQTLLLIGVGMGLHVELDMVSAKRDDVVLDCRME
eukprot:1411406-Ditylum_brightwellii.AAC.1